MSAAAQVPLPALVRISEAEDALRFDATLRELLKNPNPRIRERAALAAGRIGDDEAIGILGPMAAGDRELTVRTTAMFAIGEIESIKGTDVILGILENTREDGDLRARAIEAAGKIAAANAKNERSKDLSRAIVEALEFEAGRRSMPDRDSIILGLTAVLRVRPEGGDVLAARFLGHSDERVRADAANTLTRLRAKNANETLRKMLAGDRDPIVRANAARALGAAEDKESLAALLSAATADADQRVRVSAIRSVAQLRDASAADRLIDRGKTLLGAYGKTKLRNPSEKNELLEIAAAVGRLLAGTSNETALSFVNDIRVADKYSSPETEIAAARIAPRMYVEAMGEENSLGEDWRSASAAYQGLGEIAQLPANDANASVRLAAKLFLVEQVQVWIRLDSKSKAGLTMAIPDLLRALAAFKSDLTVQIVRPLLATEADPITRGTIADILGEAPNEKKENFDALAAAYDFSIRNDVKDNDSTLSILGALAKIDKAAAAGILVRALGASDYLVRKRAFELLSDPEMQKLKPETAEIIRKAKAEGKLRVGRLSKGSRLGVVRNRTADYRRALSRRNGSVRAVLTTEKGSFTIVFTPEEAPLTVDNFVRLARSGYFNGLTVHRVVANFVMQDGDPRGDGSGGPGWSIRCEVNMLPYERGAVGMALSGKDTGGSQWFVTHSPQPHLDGGYTVFGRVDEAGMKVVDSITRGDRILSVRIIGR